MRGAKMVSWPQFELGFVQATILTPDHSAFVASQVVATILRQSGSRFDGDMQVLPIPSGFPPEVPRASLQSKDGKWRLNAGPARIDCAWDWGNTASSALREILRQCVEVLTSYVSESKVRVGRLSLLVQRMCPNQNPADTLIQRFCNEESQREPFNRSATFEIHNHKEYVPNGGIDYRINSWVRCQCGVVEPAKKGAIVVTQDLNTLAGESEQRQFREAEIEQFFMVACDEAETIIKRYFPEERAIA